MNNRREPIAIIGIGCRLPGGLNTPEELWAALCEGRDCMRAVPSDRWDARRFYDPDPSLPGKTVLREAGFLTQRLDEFDAQFFNISPREAEQMDPQQRILLEVAWEAFEEAGIIPRRLRGSNTGVFIGGFFTDMSSFRHGALARDSIGAQTATGASHTMLSARLSYFFDLKGPAFTVDSACSSSLVAIHLACRSIAAGECEVALAGGVSIMLLPEPAITCSKGGFLSPDGRSKSFDDSANGYARGEGSVVFVLKNASAAARDGDQVYALISASGINQDGFTSGITVPNGESQRALIAQTLASTNVDHGHIRYIEAHGTGTPVGDPIEVRALAAALDKRPPEGPCYIGSIKSNFGHLEGAAGAAGVLKAALCVKHRAVPPNLHFAAANPAIDFESAGFRVPTRVVGFESKDRLHVGVNSFGYGGTNAFALISEHPCADTAGLASTGPEAPDAPPLPILLSARSTASLRAAAAELLIHLRRTDARDQLADIAYTLAQRRTHHEHRATLVARSREEAATKLELYASGKEAAHVLQGRVFEPGAQRVVFVYTGMGPQWWGMARGLIEEEPEFRTHIAECDRILKRWCDWSLLEELLRPEAESRVSDARVAQAANFAVQVSLTRLYASYGILPAAVLGHSIGDVAAAHCSGALTLEEGLLVAFHRARLQSLRSGKGAMLAASISEEHARELVAANPSVLSLAAVNASDSVTLSGEVAAIKRISAQLTFQEVFNKLLKVDVAYHSYQMEGLRADLEQALAGLRPAAPQIPYVSTVTGNAAPGCLDAAYWWRNMRDTVKFADALVATLDARPAILLEIGPHPVLAPSIRSIVRKAGVEGVCLPSLVRGRPQRDCFYESLAALHGVGHAIDWGRLVGHSGTLVPLPRYAWDRKTHWLENEASRQDRLDLGRHSLLVRRLNASVPIWETELNRQLFDFLPDHVVAGRTLVPGALFIEAGLAVAREALGQKQTALADVRFRKALSVHGQERIVQQVTYDSGTFSVRARSEKQDTWDVCASGEIRTELQLNEPASPDFHALVRAAGVELTGEAFYQLCRKRGLTYGRYFQGVRRLHVGPSWVVAEIVPGVVFNDNDTRYVLHPTYLDSAFHSLLGIQTTGGPRGTIVPVGVDELRFYHTPQGRIWSYATLRSQDAKSVVADLVLCDDAGRVCVQVRGLRCSTIAAAPNDNEVLADSLYRFAWVESLAPSSNELARAPHPTVHLNAGPLGSAVSKLLTESTADQLHVRFGDAHREWRSGEFSVSQDSSSDLSHLLEPYRELGDLTVVFWADQQVGPPRTAADVWTASAQVSLDLTALVRACAARKAPTDLWVVTRGTQQVAGETVETLFGGALWGLARVIGMEYPGIRCRLLDLDAQQATNPEFLASILRDGGSETEIALRGPHRWVQRLRRLRMDDVDMVERQVRVKASAESVELIEGTLGAAGGFAFRKLERRQPSPGEVEIALLSIGLAHEDVGALLTRGALPRASVRGSERIVAQAFGRVVASGSNVAELPVGSCVYLPTLPAVRSFLTLDAAACVPARSVEYGFPRDLALAMYCIEEVAAVRAGTHVVVHGAETPIGFAAVQWAAALGAVVLAVADPVAHAELSAAGIDSVACSGRVETVDEIAAWLRGRSIDTILVCGEGEDGSTSAALLSPLGRLVVLAGAQANVALPRPRTLGFNYSRVDVATLVQQHPEALTAVWKRALRALESSQKNSPPSLQFAIGEADLRKRIQTAVEAQARPCLVSLRVDEQPIAVQPLLNTEPVLRSGSTYLVTGGLTGFGLETAKWLAANGASQLLLVSRRGVRDPAESAEITKLEQGGCRVHVESMDIADPDVAIESMRRALRELPPLRGVVHSAMVLKDGTLAELTAQDFKDVMRPKVLGAWHLHELTKGLELDFFVLYSSVASILGAYGQSNYVAANAALEQFVRFRRSLGLPCQALSWGALSETGTVARDPRIAQYLTKIGVSGLTTSRALAGLELGIRSTLPFLGVTQVNWEEWSRFSNGAPLYSEVLPHRSSGVAAAGRLATLSEQEVLAAMRSIIADTLKLPPESLVGNVHLSNLGIDSLLSVEIVAAIEQELDVRVPTSDIAEKQTLQELSAGILNRLKMKQESAAIGGHS
ncbi:MAG: SDR family NAD(P)-dependent oxidoreductase [Deltaproteobacteria bacterium]